MTPPTIVTSDPDRLLEFEREHGAAVLKPIAGHGGRGVMALRPDDDNAPSIIDTRPDIEVIQWLERRVA